MLCGKFYKFYSNNCRHQSWLHLRPETKAHLTPSHCAFSSLAFAALSAAFLDSADLFKYASKPMPPNTRPTPIHCLWLRLWP